MRALHILASISERSSLFVAERPQPQNTLASVIFKDHKSRTRVTRSIRDREDSCRIYPSKPASLSDLDFGVLIAQPHPRVDQRNPLAVRMNDRRVEIDLRDSWSGFGQRA